MTFLQYISQTVTFVKLQVHWQSYHVRRKSPTAQLNSRTRSMGIDLCVLSMSFRMRKNYS